MYVIILWYLNIKPLIRLCCQTNSLILNNSWHQKHAFYTVYVVNKLLPCEWYLICCIITECDGPRLSERSEQLYKIMYIDEKILLRKQKCCRSLFSLIFIALELTYCIFLLFWELLARSWDQQLESALLMQLPTIPRRLTLSELNYSSFVFLLKYNGSIFNAWSLKSFRII